jgi:hypothetical protein
MTMPPPQAHSKPKTGSLTASGYSAAPSAARVHIDILSCVLSACATGAASSASSASPRTFRRLAAEQGSFALKRGMLPA